MQFDAEDLGIVMIARSLYRKVWEDDRISFIVPVIEAGANRGELIAEIGRRWGEQYGLFAITVDQLRRENDELLAQSVAASYPLALVIEPAVLLADEPKGNLDSKTGEDVLNPIKGTALHSEQRVVMVTHDARAAAYGDRIVTLRDGEIASDVGYERLTGTADRL